MSMKAELGHRATPSSATLRVTYIALLVLELHSSPTMAPVLRSIYTEEAFRVPLS